MDRKKKISKELKAMNEALKPEDLKVRISDLVNIAKDTLNVDEPEAKDFVAGMVGEEEIVEKSVSQNQQQFMGMVYKCKKTGDCASEAVRKAAEGMSKKDAKDFASTKHNGLPEKVDEGGLDFSVNQVDGLKNDLLSTFQELFGTYISYEEHSELFDGMSNKIDWAIDDAYDDYRRESIALGENDGAVSRGIEHGMNPEVQADEYEDYRQLMQQLAAEEGDNANEGMKLNQPTPRTGTARSADSPLKLNQPTPRTDGTARSADSPLKLNQKVVHTEAEGETNNPVKLKNDVKRVLAKLDMSSIQPYLAKIDNPTEQAEMIGQFSEMIGVPRNKLSSVIAQLKILSKGDSNVRENTKSNKNVIRTVKVKDIK